MFKLHHNPLKYLCLLIKKSCMCVLQLQRFVVTSHVKFNAQSLEENQKKIMETEPLAVAIIYNYFQLQNTFISKNCLVELNKLLYTLVASVDEVNGQQILHHLYIIVYHPYITIKISNLHNEMWQLKKVFKKLF